MHEDREVRWSPQAKLELEDIYGYVSYIAPNAAVRLLWRLITTAEALVHNPDRGRPVSGGVRELASVKPYIIRYRVIDGVVEIVRIRHAAQRQT